MVFNDNLNNLISENYNFESCKEEIFDNKQNSRKNSNEEFIDSQNSIVNSKDEDILLEEMRL